MVASCPSDGSVGWFAGDCGIDFTIAFEDYVLILIPAACLLLVAPLRLRNIWARTIKVVTPTISQLMKTLSSLTFVGFSFACLIASCVRSESARTAEISAAVFAFLASVTAFALSHWEHVRSIRPSKLLQLYLIVALIVQVVHLRTVWSRHDDLVLQVLDIGQVVSCAVFLAAESVGKERILLTKQRRSPQDVNDLFSERLFWWLNKLFKRGYRSMLAPGDLDETDEDLASPDIDRQFRLQWLRHYHRNPKVSLVRIVFSALKYDVLFPIIPRLLILGLSFGQPYLTMRFVLYLENTAEGGSEEGILLVVATAVLYTAMGTFQAWYWQSVGRGLVKLRGCLTTALHDKALRSRPSSKSSPLTLMNVDIERILNGIRNIHEYWSTAISIVVGLGLLYRQVGIVFLAPLALLVVLITASAINGTQVQPKQQLWFSATQNRISYITDVISSMKNVKLLGIGQSVLRRGNELRDKEVNAQRTIYVASLLNLVISLTTFQLASLFLYGAYAIRTHLGGEPLTNTRLFTSLSILKLFTAPMLTAIQMIPGTMQALAAMQRIQDYLVLEDHEDTRRINDEGQETVSKGGFRTVDEQVAARLTDITCGYASDSIALTAVSCNFQTGSLNMVVGPVGSGKSTLLKALLGETVTFKGSVSVSTEDIALCDQVSWLWNASVKDNICGTSEYDKAWFNKVTWACGLHSDFDQFPHGINTPVGSNGTSLSGGQKNRISLARALYSRKRLAVLDDVLSGLDTRTEKLVFNRVFGSDGLFSKMNCTVILATHAIGWIRYANNVIAIEKGRVIFQGMPTDAPAPYTISKSASRPGSPSGKLSGSEIVGEGCDESKGAPSPASNESTRMSDMRVYKQYLSSFGVPMTIIYIVGSILYAAGAAMQSIWLKWWAAVAPTTSHELGKYAGTFTGITVIVIINTLCFIWFSLMILLPRSSKYLHAKQWVALVQVAYASWGTKDTGSVTNRFSQDISIIDTQLSMMWINFTTLGFSVMASTAILIVATPFIAAAIPFLLVVFWGIQKVYLRTSKQLRVMDLEMKAPLCTHFLETVSGVVTINSYGWSVSYRKRNAELLAASQTPFYLMESVQNWLSLVLALVIAGLATVVMAIAVKLRSSVDAGYVGLALVEIMTLGQDCEMLIKSWTGLETSLGAISRMTEFIDDMPTEEQGRVVPPVDWLSEGKIEIHNLTASYAETAEPALKDINLRIDRGEKIAICGRTGSGKSSLASALFGLLHVQDGGIRIDGVDITEVSQDLLRSKMVALPQDPYFAPGTVRDNLALVRLSAIPVSDAAMLDVLDKVGLLEKFDALATSSEEAWLSALDIKLIPADMLTKGQTQLFAMARAMLSPGQIVLIDEATSGLDLVSEALVQKLLRHEFTGRTIVAIAHHLKTIIDFDTVVVMDNGEIAELGNPNELKDREGSLFGELLLAAEQ